MLCTTYNVHDVHVSNIVLLADAIDSDYPRISAMFYY